MQVRLAHQLNRGLKIGATVHQGEVKDPGLIEPLRHELVVAADQPQQLAGFLHERRYLRQDQLRDMAQHMILIGEAALGQMHLHEADICRRGPVGIHLDKLEHQIEAKLGTSGSRQFRRSGLPL